MTESAKQPRRRVIGRVFVALVVMVLSDLFLGTNLLMIVGLILFGWIPFLLRVVGEWRWSPVAWLTFAGCFAALAVGGHLFLTWLRRAQTPAGSPWPWRWTFGLLLLVVTTFASGIAVVGIVHQTAWIARGGIFTQQMWGSSELGLLTSLQGDFRGETRPTAAVVRAKLRQRNPEARVVVMDDDHGVWAVLVSTERDPQRLGNVGIGTPESPTTFAMTVRRKASFAEVVHEYVARGAVRDAPPVSNPAPVDSPSTAPAQKTLAAP